MINLDNQPAQSSDDDFMQNIIGTSTYDFEVPKKRVFLPWHKPRKQFVRDRQWKNLIQALVDEITPDTGVIKYLGLPGDDLLDLRYFHEKICLPNNLKLKFLGFNKSPKTDDSHQSQLEISLDEVNRLPYIDSGSELLYDDLTTIATPKSLAWDKSSKMGPFDIVNLDLCDGFAKQPSNKFRNSHYNSLSRLMSLQARRPNPWLLLLTTRVDSEGVNTNVFGKLKQIYIDNLNDCPDFLKASGDCFNFNDSNEIDNYCNDSVGFTNIFLTSLCKWILKLCVNQNPPVKVEVQNTFGYKVADSSTSPDLISIAIKITPTYGSINDTVGLADSDHELMDECALASRILRKVNGQKDVDALLASNLPLMNEMMQASKTLLVQARYDITDFDNWVRQQ